MNRKIILGIIIICLVSILAILFADKQHIPSIEERQNETIHEEVILTSSVIEKKLKIISEELKAIKQVQLSIQKDISDTKADVSELKESIGLVNELMQFQSVIE